MTRQSHTTDAVVLRSTAYGESDLILRFHARELGAITALGRSARKSRKRFGGALGLFTVSTIELRSKARSDLHTLVSAQPQRVFLELAADMVSLSHASYATELVSELAVAEQPEPDVFDLLVELYVTMSERGPSVSMLRAFELRLLGALGMAPMLSACVACGDGDEALDEGAVLDAARGGVVCAACATQSRTLGIRMLSAGARRVLRAAQLSTDLSTAHDGGTPPQFAREARDALLATVMSHVGKPLRTVEFMTKLAREDSGRS